MRRFFLIFFLLLFLVLILKKPFQNNFAKDEPSYTLSQGLRFLKIREDQAALLIFENILSRQPDNLKALWGKAEVFRRTRRYADAEGILKGILVRNPKDPSSLISLAYIRYKEDNLEAARKLIKEVLSLAGLDKENQAMAYLILGSIYSRRASGGGLFSKIRYGTQIKNYFLKATQLASDLPETHLGLGTFYLLAPALIGGNLNKAEEELELAVKMAPDFATANARLAQFYKKKQDLEKYNFYLERARRLDPENEVLKELSDEKPSGRQHLSPDRPDIGDKGR